jgi:hypothetical protein
LWPAQLPTIHKALGCTPGTRGKKVKLCWLNSSMQVTFKPLQWRAAGTCSLQNCVETKQLQEKSPLKNGWITVPKEALASVTAPPTPPPPPLPTTDGAPSHRDAQCQAWEAYSPDLQLPAWSHLGKKGKVLPSLRHSWSPDNFKTRNGTNCNSAWPQEGSTQITGLLLRLSLP